MCILIKYYTFVNFFVNFELIYIQFEKYVIKLVTRSTFSEIIYPPPDTCAFQKVHKFKLINNIIIILLFMPRNRLSKRVSSVPPLNFTETI